MLARLFTHGYDIFSPGVPIAFHQWQRSVRTHTPFKVCVTLSASAHRHMHAHNSAGVLEAQCSGTHTGLYICCPLMWFLHCCL